MGGAPPYPAMLKRTGSSEAMSNLAHPTGRRSEPSVQLSDTLLTLLRHAEATNTERDGVPAAR